MNVDFHPYLGPVSESQSFDNGQKRFRVDGLGCRWNPQLAYDHDEIPIAPVRILVGGSVVFGVGASNDEATIASQITLLDGTGVYPIGERALGSWQELQGFLARYTYLQPRDFVLLSGYNDAFWTSRYLNAPENLRIGRRLVGVVNSPFLAQSNLGFASLGTSRLRRILATLIAGITKLDLLREAILVRHPIRKWPSVLSNIAETVADHEQVQLEVLKSMIATTSVWSALSKSLGCQMSYFLPPSHTWMSSMVGEVSHLFKGSPDQQDFFIRLRTEFVQVLSENAVKHGFYFCDLNAKLLTIPNWTNLFVDDCHLTDEGQRVLAKLIVSNWNTSS